MFWNIPAHLTTFYKILIASAICSWNLQDPHLKMIHENVQFKNELTNYCPKPNSLFTMERGRLLLFMQDYI